MDNLVIDTPIEVDASDNVSPLIRSFPCREWDLKSESHANLQSCS